VEYAVTPDEHRHILGVSLYFQYAEVSFRVEGPSGNLCAEMHPLVLGPAEEKVLATKNPLWSACLGLWVRRVWSLTNDQSQTEGVRIMFEDVPGVRRTIVELMAEYGVIHPHRVIEKPKA
jgi:hypothetical protein